MKSKVPKKLAAELHEKISSATPILDHDLDQSIQRARTLLRLLNNERERRAVARAEAGPSLDLSTVGLTDAEPVILGSAGRTPKRDAIVLALAKIGFASPPSRIAALATKMFGLTVSTSQFASFRKGDERAYRRNPRNRIYIVPALSAADLSGMAGTVTLSNWPLERRMIGGYSQRADTFRALGQAYATFADTQDETSRELVLIIARELPSLNKHSPDLAAMAKAAALELEQIAASDEEERQRAAVRMAQLDPVSQLFGRPPLSVVEGG